MKCQPIKPIIMRNYEKPTNYINRQLNSSGRPLPRKDLFKRQSIVFSQAYFDKAFNR